MSFWVHDLTSRPFFCRGPNAKYFSLCGPYSLSYKYLTLPRQYKNSHRRHINEWAWLYSNFTYGHLSTDCTSYSPNEDLLFTLHNQATARVKELRFIYTTLYTTNVSLNVVWLLIDIFYSICEATGLESHVDPFFFAII